MTVTITFLIHASQDLDQVTLASINSFLLINAFDKGLEVRGLLLNISKAFDKVWNDSLIFKLRQNGIRGDIINILREILLNGKQSVVLNCHYSSWADFRTGVSQGSILGPLLFLIHIKDLSDGLKSKCKLFADDTSLFSVVYDINTSASDLNEDLGNWAFRWKLTLTQTLIPKLKKLYLVGIKLPHYILLHTLIRDQLNQHQYTNILGWYLIQISAMSTILNLFQIKLIRKFLLRNF